MKARLLQCNLNHSWGAQDVMMQYVLEENIAVCMVSEPISIPVSPAWFESGNRRAAIYVNPESSKNTAVRCRAGRNSITIKYGSCYLTSVYVSPNVDDNEYLEALDELDEAHSFASKQRHLVCGDFNARSPQWSASSSNKKGEYLEEWAAQNDLRLLNTGVEPTCIRPQGFSTVDLSWCSPDMVCKIREWNVESTVTLSDHLYITMTLESSVDNTHPRGNNLRSWNFKKLDQEMLVETLEWKCATTPFEDLAEYNAQDWVKWLDATMAEACDLAAPRSKARGKRRTAYWWSESLADARRRCTIKQRAWTKSKRRGDPGITEALRKEYRAEMKGFRKEISKAKHEAWMELLASIEEDPWGLPYKVVLRKLRNPALGLSETLDKDSLDRLITSLFPEGDTQRNKTDWSNWTWNEEHQITPGEVYRLLKKNVIKNTAPGIDGIKSNVWKRIPLCMLDRLTACYNTCLREGVFPSQWKVAKLVLIPKDGMRPDGLPKARPICLLNDIGKFLERIIADRIVEWISNNDRANLSENQYGFRKQRATLDAILAIKEKVKDVTQAGGVAIGVSLDISNAFNSLPWGVIRRALERKGIPEYIRRIIDDYLTDRRILVVSGKDGARERPMTAGVPQGSVLGPLLWNLAYDDVLRVDLEEGCSVIGYADDTFILATAEDEQVASHRASQQTARVLLRIKNLGLQVAESKTEVILFHGKRYTPARVPEVVVGGSRIQATESMKYLGLILDSRLDFMEHCAYMEGKVGKVTRALGRLMPNLRGPQESKRRLYAGVVASVALYGAPVWYEEVSQSRKGRQTLNKIGRLIAIRVVAGYRTVSHDAATLLARFVPLLLASSERHRVFLRSRDAIRNGIWTTEAEADIKEMEATLTRRQWSLLLSRPDVPGVRTIRAVLPVMGGWLDREHGQTSFHFTQLATGHGCFNTYIHRIGKTDSPICSQCETTEDSAEHTLQVCERWQEERRVLVSSLGLEEEQLNLEGLIKAMLEGRDKWNAGIGFAGKVMRTKEEEERQREIGVEHQMTDSETP